MIPNGEHISQTIICKHCNVSFDITDFDRAYYKTVEVPEPTSCPKCREISRAMFRNEHNFYHAECFLCKKSIITIYQSPQESPILCQKCFGSDKWNPISYGIKFDFLKSFSENFMYLLQKVPKVAMLNDDSVGSVNCEYTYNVSFAKDCYLVDTSWKIENCLYCSQLSGVKNSMGIHFARDSEKLYESDYMNKCYDCKYCTDCENCSECLFCSNMTSCTQCFMCTNLQHKKYYFKNTQYTPEEYAKIVLDAKLWSDKSTKQLKKSFETWGQHCLTKNLHIQNCENISKSDHVSNCANSSDIFEANNVNKSKFFWIGDGAENCYDCTVTGGSNWCYDCVVADNSYMVSFSFFCRESRSCSYCYNCLGCEDCFACISLKKGRYCIFNTQYSHEEYKKVKQKIIDLMMQNKEWGRFFGPEMCPHSYNETLAMESYPLSREEALTKGYTWQDNIPGTYGKETLVSLPDDIRDATPDICEGICKCETCAKNYKIVPQELDYLYKNNLPLPRECFDCRRQRRFEKRNKRTMRDVPCHECGKIVPTTYPENFTGKICCEECYRKMVY